MATMPEIRSQYSAIMYQQTRGTNTILILQLKFRILEIVLLSKSIVLLQRRMPRRVPRFNIIDI